MDAGQNINTYPLRIGIIVVSSMRKKRLKEVKWLVCCHISNEQQSRNLKQSTSDSKLMFTVFRDTAQKQHAAYLIAPEKGRSQVLSFLVIERVF